jgi:aspartyl-tRNA(Asn)/glutamyl-tRNA(Gln) amidotransferase subunit A
MNDLVTLSIRDAGQRLSRREISSAELVEAELERIAETDPLVHAYAEVMEETARKEAAQADRELARGIWRGPLHGIPIAYKDLVYTTQAPTAAGSRVLEGWMAGYDATVLRRLREAGAVTLGKTHTHEFAYGVNIPPTRNPWRLDSYPGGSSAGSGVSVAVRSAFGAIGTDGGGSIRCPAAVNGVVGLKPTTGRVSRRGVVPMSSTFDNVGPLARTVEDCALMLTAMAGHDPADPTSLEEPVHDYTAGIRSGVRGLRLGIERDFFFSSRVAPDVLQAVQGALELLQSAGAELVEVRIPELEYSGAAAMPALVADTTAFHRQWLRRRGHLYERPTRVMIELGELIPATHYVRAQRARRLLRDRFRNAFEMFRLDALVAPTLPGPTVPVEELNLDLTDGSGESPGSSYFRNCVGANVVGVPALSVPAGFTWDELPIGIAFWGRPLQEALLFRIARAYEAQHPWHRRVPPLQEAASPVSPPPDRGEAGRGP